MGDVEIPDICVLRLVRASVALGELVQPVHVPLGRHVNSLHIVRQPFVRILGPTALPDSQRVFRKHHGPQLAKQVEQPVDVVGIRPPRTEDLADGDDRLVLHREPCGRRSECGAGREQRTFAF